MSVELNLEYTTAIEAITDPRRTHDMDPPLGNVQMQAITGYLRAVKALPLPEQTVEIVKLLDCWGKRYLTDNEVPRLSYGIKTILLLANHAAEQAKEEADG